MDFLQQKLRIQLLKENLIDRIIDRFLSAIRTSKINDYEEWIKQDPEFIALSDRIARESERLKSIVDRAKKAEKQERRIKKEKEKQSVSDEARKIATSIARKELQKSLGFYGLK